MISYDHEDRAAADAAAAVAGGSPGADDALVRRVHNAFSEEGVLSRSPDFEFRAEQQAMAVAVARSWPPAIPRWASDGQGFLWPSA